jgi:hypothetical protein
MDSNELHVLLTYAISYSFLPQAVGFSHSHTNQKDLDRRKYARRLEESK